MSFDRRNTGRLRPTATATAAEQGYRACIGILRLGRQYGAARLEAACDRGLDIGARSYGSIQLILKHGLDKQPARAARQSELLPDHPNPAAPATTIEEA
jgi:hypothetical protein